MKQLEKINPCVAPLPAHYHPLQQQHCHTTLLSSEIQLAESEKYMLQNQVRVIQVKMSETSLGIINPHVAPSPPSKTTLPRYHATATLIQ